MKRFMLSLAAVAVAAVLASCSLAVLPNEQSGGLSSAGATSSRPQGYTPITPQGEVRAMWISYSELGDAFESGSFKAEFDKMMEGCLALGINTVYVHVRAFCDSFYPSQIFPWSRYARDSEGNTPDFDPLEYMVTSAHSRGIAFHAWINPYRVSHTSCDYADLPEGSPVAAWQSDGDKSNDEWSAAWEDGIYLVPSEVGAQRLILQGVTEIMDNYPVDGIHIDDYFYPTTDEEFDEGSYAAYRMAVSGYTLPLDDWRRAAVNSTVSMLSSAVRQRGLQFGISPAANNDRNYNELYADVAEWIEKGWVDYVIPQIYYGFEYPVQRFTYTALLTEWCALAGDKVPLYVGLGAYRIGDSTATGGSEWCAQDAKILARQVTALREAGCEGFAIFSYSSIMNEGDLASFERAALQQVIKSEEQNQTDG